MDGVSPASLFYLHHLRSCAANAIGAKGAALNVGVGVWSSHLWQFSSQSGKVLWQSNVDPSIFIHIDLKGFFKSQETELGPDLKLVLEVHLRDQASIYHLSSTRTGLILVESHF